MQFTSLYVLNNDYRVWGLPRNIVSFLISLPLLIFKRMSILLESIARLTKSVYIVLHRRGVIEHESVISEPLFARHKGFDIMASIRKKNNSYEIRVNRGYDVNAKLNLRSTSYERMKQLITRVYPALGHLRLDKITGRHIQQFGIRTAFKSS